MFAVFWGLLDPVLGAMLAQFLLFRLMAIDNYSWLLNYQMDM